MALVTLHPLTPTLLLGLAALAVLAYDSVYPSQNNRTVLSGIAVVGALLSLATTVVQDDLFSRIADGPGAGAIHWLIGLGILHH